MTSRTHIISEEFKDLLLNAAEGGNYLEMGTTILYVGASMIVERRTILEPGCWIVNSDAYTYNILLIGNDYSLIEAEIQRR